MTLSSLAARSGVSRATLYRVDRDPSSAMLATLREIAIAGGLDLDVVLRPVSDAAAAAAARAMFEAGHPSIADLGLEAWAGRIRRNGGDSPAECVRYAGSMSAPLARPGAHLFRGSCTSARAASAGDASGGRWALSGRSGFEALGVEPDDSVPVILWCEDADAAARTLGGDLRAVASPELANLVVIGARSDLFIDSWTADGLHVAAPIQVALDGFGIGTDPAVTAAMRLIEDW